MKEVEVAFLLSLAAGAILLVGGLSWMTWASGGWQIHMVEHMWGEEGMTPFRFNVLVSAICGAIIIVAAIALKNHPRRAPTWGIVILITSLVSLIGFPMMFSPLGAILGIIGGAMAMTIKTELEPDHLKPP